MAEEIDMGRWLAALALGAARCPATAQAAGFDDTFGINGTVFTSLSRGQRPLPGRHARAGRRHLQRRLHDGRRAPTARWCVTHVDAAGAARSRLRRRRRRDRQRRHRSVRRAARRHHADRRGRDRPRGRRPGRRQDRDRRPGRDAARRRASRTAATSTSTSRASTPRACSTPPSAPAASSASTSATAAAPANAINGDQAYGLEIRPDGKLVVFGSKGLDFAEPGAHRPRHRRRPARDRRRPGPDLRHRRRRDDAQPGREREPAPRPHPGRRQDHRHRLRHAASATPTRPFIYRFNANGTTDATFGTGGVATDEVGGPAPGFAEVYGVVQQGDKYVFAGYGSRSTTPANGIDVVALPLRRQRRV